MKLTTQEIINLISKLSENGNEIELPNGNYITDNGNVYLITNEEGEKVLRTTNLNTLFTYLQNA